MCVEARRSKRTKISTVTTRPRPSARPRRQRPREDGLQHLLHPGSLRATTDPFTAAAKLDMAFVVVVVVVVPAPTAVVGTVMGKRHRTLSDLRVPGIKTSFRETKKNARTQPTCGDSRSVRTSMLFFLRCRPEAAKAGTLTHRAGSAGADWPRAQTREHVGRMKTKTIDNDDAGISAAAPRRRGSRRADYPTAETSGGRRHCTRRRAAGRTRGCAETRCGSCYQ